MAYDFKRPEEVKEYLKNLHIEYQFGCYSEKNGEVCHLLAEFKSVIKKEFDKAAELYKLACDKYSYGRSCTKYGDAKSIGKGCSEDLPTAFKYLVKGCELNDASGCFRAGAIGLSDQLGEDGREERTKKSIEYLSKACEEHKLEKACFYLSGVYLSGVEGYVEKNMQEAYKLTKISCDGGNPAACANLYQMYARGEGVEKDLDLAEKYKQRALDLKAMLEGRGGLSLKFGE